MVTPEHLEMCFDLNSQAKKFLSLFVKQARDSGMNRLLWLISVLYRGWKILSNMDKILLRGRQESTSVLVRHPALHNSLSRCVVSLFLMLTHLAHNTEKDTHDNSLVTQSFQVSLQKYRWLGFPVDSVGVPCTFCLLHRAGKEFLYQTGNRLGWPIGAVWSKAAVTPLYWADKFAGKKKWSFRFLSQIFTSVICFFAILKWIKTG